VVDLRQFSISFFECPIAMQVRVTVCITFDVKKKPRSMSDISGEWIKSFNVKQRKHVLLDQGSGNVLAIWRSGNNLVFQRSKPCSCLHVIFKSSFWIRSWSILMTMEEERRCLLFGSRCLGTTALIRNLQQV
jgi:hypothetical protein